MWSTADIADAVHAALAARARQADLEQAVYGIDALDELALHSIVHQALRDAGYGVYPEERYPSDRLRSRRSEGLRCDVALTPEPTLMLRDPAAEGTLFADHDAMDADEAFWLEIKTVAQFEASGPFARYSAELLSCVTQDVRKLWSDALIRWGAVLLVLFTCGREVAEHDLTAWHQRCIERGYALAAPAVRGTAITDRMGNGWCTTAVFGVRG